MVYRIFDDMKQCSEDEVRRMLARMPQQRRDKALRFKHLFGQYACLKSYEMLHQLMKEEGLCSEQDELLFCCSEHGKPFLPAFPQVHFNISHCKNALAVALDSHPVGIDVERFTFPQKTLLDYTMNAQEVEQVCQSATPDQTFAVLWTRKEALFKCFGTGITDDIKDTLTHHGTDVEMRTLVCPDKQYACSIAYQHTCHSN